MTDLDILVEHNPSPAKLDVLGVEGWPIWRKDPGHLPLALHPDGDAATSCGGASASPRRAASPRNSAAAT